MDKIQVLVEIQRQSDDKVLEVIRRLEAMGFESESDQKHDIFWESETTTVVIRGFIARGNLSKVKNYPTIVNVWLKE
ncbi:MAG: hypothetical protein Q8R36_04275 [bacterium]|nr:hypothetical protein [bacterium]